MPLTFLENKEGVFENITATSGINNKVGWWNSLVGSDFDKDGDIDYIAGNLGLNTLNKASNEQPIAVYAADFDGNKGFDVVPTVYFLDEQRTPQEFPFFGRSDVQKQVLPVRRSYPQHAQFARATADQIFGQFKEVIPLKLTANHLQTSYIENKGDGTFEITSLPIEAQFAPIYGMAADDFNQDGHTDILLSGNDYGMEVSMGRHDGFNGLLLLGNGRGGFKPTTMQESGVVIPYDAKSLVRLKNKGGDLLIAAQNGGKLRLLQTAATNSIEVQPLDAFGLLTDKDGATYKQELYYGNTFLSQSSRQIILPQQLSKIEVVQFNGQRRSVSPIIN